MDRYEVEIVDVIEVAKFPEIEKDPAFRVVNLALAADKAVATPTLAAEKLVVTPMLVKKPEVAEKDPAFRVVKLALAAENI